METFLVFLPEISKYKCIFQIIHTEILNEQHLDGHERSVTKHKLLSYNG